MARSRASWLALVAATTLGAGYFQAVRAEVLAGGAPARMAEGRGYRLIVQSYDARSLGDGGQLDERARPLASTQRAITADELRRGVNVDVLHVGGEAHSVVDQVVVAWVEAGEPDLDFDGLTARPGAGAVFGVSGTLRGAARGRARVVLERRYAGA